MIKNFSDHAANERTFLAWVRTAIAVMAFGFLVEKFGLFIQLASASAVARSASSIRFGGVAGLALMLIGIAMVALATFRFLRTAKQIDEPIARPGTGARLDVALAVLLFLLGCALFAYLTFNLVAPSSVKPG